MMAKVCDESGETADAGGWLRPRIVVSLVLSNIVSFKREEIETFIDELCTNYIFISNLQSYAIVLIYAVLLCFEYEIIIK